VREKKKGSCPPNWGKGGNNKASSKQKMSAPATIKSGRYTRNAGKKNDRKKRSVGNGGSHEEAGLWGKKKLKGPRKQKWTVVWKREDAYGIEEQQRENFKTLAKKKTDNKQKRLHSNGENRGGGFFKQNKTKT